MEPDDQIDEINPYKPPCSEVEFVKTAPTRRGHIDLSAENPFLTIWTRPRATIRGIVDTNPFLHVIPLALVRGIVQTIDRAVQQNAGVALSLPTILALAVFLGPLGGLIGLFVGGWFTRTSGRWLGGSATPEQVRAAIAWSSVPDLATIPILMIQIGLFGREMFTLQKPTIWSDPLHGAILVVSGLLEAVLGIWSFVILLKCVGEVQGFSAWRALGSFILIGVIIIVPIMLLLVLVLLASR
jgi:Yip1 domain